MMDYDKDEQELLRIIQDYRDMYEKAVQPYIDRLEKIRSIRMGPLSAALDLQEYRCLKKHATEFEDK